jgi:hypothetical protein
MFCFTLYTEEYTVKIIHMDTQYIGYIYSFSSLCIELNTVRAQTKFCRSCPVSHQTSNRHAVVQGNRFLRKHCMYLLNHMRCILKDKLYLSLCSNGQSHDQSKLSPTDNQNRTKIHFADHKQRGAGRLRVLKP